MLSIENHNFDIKHIFDHIRNIGLSALILISGWALFNTDFSQEKFKPIAPEFFGGLLLVIGVILFFFNFIFSGRVLLKNSQSNKSYVALFVLWFVWCATSLYGLLFVQLYLSSL